MNDARLYSLESRVHQEEEIRIKEFDFIRDCVKKLIYSFEQSNLNTIDEMSHVNDNFNKSMTDGFASNNISLHATNKKSGTAIPNNQFKMLLNTNSM